MSGFPVLRAYLEARASFQAHELDFIEQRVVARRLRAGECLLRAGEVAAHSAFVTKGCLRKYIIDSKGKEHVVQFAPETWWTGDDMSVTTGKPSEYFIEALEDSETLLLAIAAHNELLAKVPGYANAFQTGMRKHAAKKDERIVRNLSATAEERYLEFMQTYPGIAGRVPQRMLASYLGVSPETVSRIRRKLTKKGSA